MIPVRLSFVAVVILLLLRAIMAALLPLSADEAYYWLWSQHLAAGYYDHPPAIAWLIRAGTALFGNTPFGVRFLGVVLSVPASWLVWRSAGLLLKDASRAALAVLFFNLTLMISVEMLAATPDMPSIVTSAALLYALAQVQASGNGKWWLAVGAAAGLGLLSKFSALFLGAGTLLWLLVDARHRKWLATPWPYLGAAVALVIWAPALAWQSQHHWETFAFQFGRVGTGHFTLRFIGEFLAAQMGLATPLIFVLMVVGLVAATRRGSPLLMPAVLAWVAIGYFLQHALHDRVQGNWPCFIFPALAVLAASAFSNQGWRRLVSWLAAPLAALLLLLVYAQAQVGLFHLKKDPMARILGRDFAPIADVVAAMVKAHLVDAVLTSDYETTAWLRFNQPSVPVIQINEPQRYTASPAPSAALWQGRLFYLAELRRDRHDLALGLFRNVGFPTQLQTPSSRYMLYPMGRPIAPPAGRMP